MKVAQNEKGKKLLGFSFYINIGNSEAFLTWAQIVYLGGVYGVYI